MNFDLRQSTVFLTLSGSRAYGFHNAESDYDYRGICIPPLNTYIGIGNKFEQAVDNKTKHIWKNYSDLVQTDSDMQIMELSKFCRLALDCNPSIIEILFSDEDSFIYKHPIMNVLLNNRKLFLSKRAKARFCGYALSQLNRIKRHKRWLDNPPTHEPLRSHFGLPDKEGLVSADQIGSANALIKQEIDGFVVDQNDLPEHTKIELSLNLDKMMRAVWASLNTTPFPIGENQRFDSMNDALAEMVMRQNGFDRNFIEVLKKEKQYRAARQEWESYQHWLQDRNPARAELEKKFGYDTKHACHLVRLIRMCREILETGQVLVKRPDAEELRMIRSGSWSYEGICEFAEAEDKALSEVVKQSKLPSAPDMERIQEIVYSMILNFNLGDLEGSE